MFAPPAPNSVTVRERVRRIDTFIHTGDSDESKNPHGNGGRPSRFLHAVVYDRDRQNSDTQSAGTVSSMTVLEREWLHATLALDYHRMCALLRKQPSLASFRDYVTGTTALHRAVMSPDCIKLLVGSYKANVDARSYSGATALHMLAQKLANASRSNVDEDGLMIICELLVRTYSGNVAIRDYSGRQAVHYLPLDAPQRIRDLLTPQRLDSLLAPSVYSALFGTPGSSGAECKQPQPTATLNSRLRSAFVFRQRASHDGATLTPPKTPRSWLPPSFTNAVRGVTRQTPVSSAYEETQPDNQQEFVRGPLRRSISADNRSQNDNAAPYPSRTLYESGV